VCASKDGGLWITTSLGLSHLATNEARNYSQATPGVGFASDYLKVPFEARNGDVYLIDGDKNIEILSGGRVVKAYANSNWPTAFAEDDQGVVVSVGNDLLRVSRSGLSPYLFNGNESPLIYWVRSMSSGRDGSILIASVNGVFRVKNGTFEHWSLDNGLLDAEVISVCEDADGVIWAGMSSGLARINGRQIRNITRNDGLLDSFIYALIPDDHGSFWINSSSGIFRVSRKSLNDVADGKATQVDCKPFNGLEAVKSAETTEVEYSGCKTLDGRIWFPNPLGVVMIDPTNLFTNPIPPPAHIQHIRANGVLVTGASRVRIPPGNGQIDFEYTAPSFIAPEKVRFRYRLEGYDPDWVDAGSRRSVYYTNMKPGAYRFHLQACNADGVWNKTEDAFGFELLPRFYQTAWFLALCVGLGVGSLIGFYAWRMKHLLAKERQLQKANEVLESKVNERTREVAEQRNLLRTLIDTLPDHFFVKDVRGRVVVDNIAHARMLGVKSPDDAVGRTDFDHLNAELAGKYRSDEQRVIDLGDVYNGEETLTDLQTGEKRWFQTTKVPLRDPEGKIVGLAGINRDVTERRKTEQELRQKTALFEALVNSSLDGIMVVGTDGRRILQNQQTIDQWKIPADVVSSEADEAEMNHIKGMAVNPEEFSKEILRLYSHPNDTIRGEIQLKNGTVLDRYTAPIRGKDGNYYGRIWMFRDITERKRLEAEMDRAHKELLEVSRQAGMAEVATSVLHNVGNVLNSVNVSVSVVEERIRKTGASSLAKVLALLREHENDLAGFLTQDARGRQLIGYMGTLVQHLEAEKAGMLEEMASLVRNIEHIKEIVATQQTYARVGGVTEIVKVADLVEDAVRMHASSYERHGVALVREYSEVPAITVDRHKIIQILLNLIQNAKQACEAADSGDRKVIVRIGMAGPGRIRIEVADNGIGIPPENKTRIFSHGFTTRKNGHGFGLHSGALAAREMGGSLTATSEGHLKGATFTIELPVECAGRPPAPDAGGRPILIGEREDS
jgi:PAS domain S-box-containing protein